MGIELMGGDIGRIPMGWLAMRFVGWRTLKGAGGVGVGGVMQECRGGQRRLRQLVKMYLFSSPLMAEDTGLYPASERFTTPLRFTPDWVSHLGLQQLEVEVEAEAISGVGLLS